MRAKGGRRRREGGGMGAAGRRRGAAASAVVAAAAVALGMAALVAPAEANVAGAFLAPKAFSDSVCREPLVEDNPQSFCKTVGDCPEKIKLKHCYRTCNRDACTPDQSFTFYAHRLHKNMVRDYIMFPNNNCTLNDKNEAVVFGSLAKDVDFGKRVCIKTNAGSEETKFYKKYGPTEALLVFFGLLIGSALVVGGIIFFKRHQGATLGAQAAAMKMRMNVGNYSGSMAMGRGASIGNPQDAGASPAQVSIQA